MVTGELKNKIDGLWEIFWTGGVTNPLSVVEQMAQLQKTDVRGDVYEYLLSKIATAGVNGQFRTPRHIIRMMVEMMETKADDVVCDKRIASLIQASGKDKSSKSLDIRGFEDFAFVDLVA